MTDPASSRRVKEVAWTNVEAAYRQKPTEADERFRVLFEASFDYLWNTLRRLGVAPRDLEDVTHDVLLTVYRKFDTYDPARPLRPWLFAFGLRAASEYRRRIRSRREVSEYADPVDRLPLADERLQASEERALVAAALETLDLERRAVFVMHDLDEIPVPEIAQTLAIPLNTAYSRLRIAREQFVRAITRLRAKENR